MVVKYPDVKVGVAGLSYDRITVLKTLNYLTLRYSVGLHAMHWRLFGALQ